MPFALLQAIADLPDEALRRGLDHLQAAKFLDEIGLYPDLEYSFTHALTHDVTYGALLQDRRRELHARVVDVIETLQRDRLGEQIERLAHHAVRGELREKAVHYLRQTGLKAAARSALPDARVWFEQALGILVALPESPSNGKLRPRETVMSWLRSSGRVARDRWIAVATRGRPSHRCRGPITVTFQTSP